MNDYLMPTDSAHEEFTEKRSRFIGYIKPVETEVEAKAFVDEIKRKHHDARHNCWCYILHDGGIVRYSDDGEPQGTAGQPMLEVLKREGVENVCCVVTRYFGGILLGAGGLLRAYTRGAKLALDASGISIVQELLHVAVRCSYAQFEKLKLEIEAQEGLIVDMEYGADVRMEALFSENKLDIFRKNLTEMTAATAQIDKLGTQFRAVPRKNK